MLYILEENIQLTHIILKWAPHHAIPRPGNFFFKYSPGVGGIWISWNMLFQKANDKQRRLISWVPSGYIVKSIGARDIIQGEQKLLELVVL